MGPAKETNLKYITPITPHHNEAPTVKSDPSKYFFFHFRLEKVSAECYIL